MCGIAGITGPARDRNWNTQVISLMLNELRHRGPDDCGTWVADGVALGSARLGQIDGERSHQPMHSDDGRYVLCLNGEILNYVELRQHPKLTDWTYRTEGDTEVLLALLSHIGTDGIQLINGQFACALWDRYTRTLTLIRDRLGIVPLFYARLPNRLAFASSVTALMMLREVDLSLDPEALLQLMTFWTPRAPVTSARGIRQIPPGSLLQFRDEKLTITRYWTPKFDARLSHLTQVTKAEMLSELLERSVGRCSRADGEVGTLVSGGIDSATLTALASSQRSQVTSYSITFDNPVYDESHYQRTVIAAARTSHTTARCSAPALAEALPLVVAATETPFLRFGPCATYLLGRHIKDNGSRCVISGEGADELFCGYDLFKETILRQREPAVDASAVLSAGLGATPAERISPLVTIFLLEDPTIDERFASHAIRWNSAQALREYVEPDFWSYAPDPLEVLASELPSDYANWTPLSKAQYLELLIFLPDYLLSTQCDRSLMAHGVEARFPFLDNDVVAFALSLDDQDKLCGTIEKRILRLAMHNLIPAEIAHRPKQAYQSPIIDVLRSDPGMEIVRDLLNDRELDVEGVFNSAKVNWLVRRLKSDIPLSNTNGMALAAIITTRLWQNYISNGLASRRL
jgi:asparagine synthase (glutamine-hydrolysing)